MVERSEIIEDARQTLFRAKRRLRGRKMRSIEQVEAYQEAAGKLARFQEVECLELTTLTRAQGAYRSISMIEGTKGEQHVVIHHIGLKSRKGNKEYVGFRERKGNKEKIHPTEAEELFERYRVGLKFFGEVKRVTV